LLVALGIAAVDAGHKVRYFTAAELIETLYRALADNSVGRVIENPLRNDLVPRRTRLRTASAGQSGFLRGSVRDRPCPGIVGQTKRYRLSRGGDRAANRRPAVYEGTARRP
jgi:hypothetical protein